MYTRLAQLEERSAFNRVVVGSIPTSGGNMFYSSLFCYHCLFVCFQLDHPFEFVLDG